MSTDLWFRLPKKDPRLPGLLAENFRSVVAQSSWREDLYLRCLRLYSDVEMMGLPGFSYQRLILPANRLRLNVVKAVVDTSTALVSTTRTKVKMLTQGGKTRNRRKSERITKFLGGQFHHHGVYSSSAPVYQLGALLGHCGLQVTEDDEQLDLERVPPTELWVDEIEARYGDPRTLFRYTDMGMDAVGARYGLTESDLAGAGPILPKYQLRQQLDKPVGVLQAWRLPSHPGADDGRYAVLVGEHLVPVDDVWLDSKFPIPLFTFAPRPLCWGGQGLGEALTDIQLELNWLLRKVQSCLNLATTHILVSDTAKVRDEQFTNGDLSIIRFTGTLPPEWRVVQAISPEYYQQIERLYQRAFEITGTSQQIAMARKAAGIQSGSAIREANDLQSVRIQQTQQSWEQFHVDIGDRMVRGANRLNKKIKGGYRVPVEDLGYLQPTNWSELEFDPDVDFYWMQPWPVSLLPDTPAAKIDTLIDMAKAGLVDQQSATMMLGRGHPDVEALVNRAMAAQAVCDRLIEQILDKGVSGYQMPLPIYPLELFIREFGRAYMEAQLDGVQEDRLDLLIRWIKQAQDLLLQTQAPTPAAVPPGAPPGMPPGAPGAMLQIPGAPGSVPGPMPTQPTPAALPPVIAGGLING
jgi:hypothetical protein